MQTIREATPDFKLPIMRCPIPRVFTKLQKEHAEYVRIHHAIQDTQSNYLERESR
jgi:hypothetical protein